MAKKLSKGKRSYLLEVVNRVKREADYEARVQRQARAYMAQYC